MECTKASQRSGEFLNDAEGKEVLRRAEEEDFSFAAVEDLGKEMRDDTMVQKHIDTW